MRDPPMVEMTVRYTGLSEVLIILPTDSSHRLLEAGEFILEVFNVLVKNVQLSGLPAHHFGQFVGLEKESWLIVTN